MAEWEKAERGEFHEKETSAPEAPESVKQEEAPDDEEEAGPPPCYYSEEEISEDEDGQEHEDGGKEAQAGFDLFAYSAQCYMMIACQHYSVIGP